MLFDQSKRRDLSTLLGRAAAWPRGGRQGQPLPYSPASESDRPIHVLILIPTLNVGGAEMDLVRTVPRIDRARFRVTVCTFLERGELSELMQGHGIGVIGPFSPLYYFRLRLRCMAQKLMALLRSPLKATPSALRQRIRRIAKSIWTPLAGNLPALGIRQHLSSFMKWALKFLQTSYSPLRGLFTSWKSCGSPGPSLGTFAHLRSMSSTPFCPIHISSERVLPGWQDADRCS